MDFLEYLELVLLGSKTLNFLNYMNIHMLFQT